MLPTRCVLCIFFMAWTTSKLSPVLAQTNGATNEVLPRSSADLIVPILDLRYQSLEECGSGRTYHCTNGTGLGHEEARAKTIGKLVAHLIRNNSSPADRAIVVLLYYDVGPSEAEDLLASLTARGKRVLPYLLKSRDSMPRIPGRDYPDSMLNGREFRREMFDHVIQEIERGHLPNQQ